jgi:hypothetical protein
MYTNEQLKTLQQHHLCKIWLICRQAVFVMWMTCKPGAAVEVLQ